jgi:hypothetical protein
MPKKCNPIPYIAPIHTYGRTDGISVTGGYVYRGTKIPELYGKYLFADYGSGNVWALPLDAFGKRSGNVTRILEKAGSISSFAEDQNGELYLIDHRAGKLLLIQSVQ